jgi:3-hydroxybutyrate dehydrogenase
MLKQNEGVILNVSSVAGLIGSAGTVAYTTSKHGVLGLTKVTAL